MALDTIEPFLNVFLMTFGAAPGLELMTAAAEHILCIDQTGGFCRMAAVTGNTLVPMVLVHRLPRLTLAFMTKGT